MLYARGQGATRPVACSSSSKITLTTISQPTITVEKRAADVLVLGDSPTAAAAAFSLARRGKKVVHLPDFGIQRAGPPKESLRLLNLLDTDVRVASMASEAASYFQGLELQAGAPLLWRTASLDLAATHPHSVWPTAAGGAASPALEHMAQLAEVAKQAGIKVAGVKPGDLLTRYPMLRLSNQVSGLLQPDGGVISASAVLGALQSLGKRSGVLLRAGLRLRGWQDTGSCLRVQAASVLQPEAVSVFEVEQVLLAPGTWPLDCLQLWGLQLPGLQLLERRSVRCGASEDLSRLPVLRFWSVPDEQQAANMSRSSSSSSTSGSQPAPRMPQPQLASGRGGHQQDLGSLNMQGATQSLGRGAAAATAAINQGAAAAAERAAPAEGTRSFVLFPRLAAAPATCKLAAVPEHARTCTTCWQLPSDNERGAPAASPSSPTASRDAEQQQLRQQQSDGSMLQALAADWRQAADMVKGLSPPAPDTADEGGDGPSSSRGEAEEAPSRQGVSTCAWDLVSPDGLPLLGWHPGFEQGRVMVVCAAGARHGRQSDGFQLAPLLAKAAAELLQGQAVLDLPADVHSLALSRPSLLPAGDEAQGPMLVSGDWDMLQDLQTGALYARLQRQAEEERGQ